MNYKLFSLFFFLIVILGMVNIYGQNINARLTDSTHLAIVKLNDGTIIQGKITKVNAKELTIVSSLGTNIIESSKIKETREVPTSSLKNGVYWFPNPNKTRLVFAPTAFMLKPGEGYFQDIYLYFLAANIGITDNFSIGITSLLPVFKDFNIIVLTPKTGIEVSENIRIAAGGFLGYVSVNGGDGASFGLGYGVATFGSENENITIGGGFSYAGGKISKNPVFVLGGSIRITKGFGFVTENYFVIYDETTTKTNPYGYTSITTSEKQIGSVFSAGVRFFGERMTFDTGLWNNPTLASETGLYGIPYASFVVKF